jgi:hypothetical protein
MGIRSAYGPGSDPAEVDPPASLRWEWCSSAAVWSLAPTIGLKLFLEVGLVPPRSKFLFELRDQARDLGVVAGGWWATLEKPRDLGGGVRDDHGIRSAECYGLSMESYRLGIPASDVRERCLYGIRIGHD